MAIRDEVAEMFQDILDNTVNWTIDPDQDFTQLISNTVLDVQITNGRTITIDSTTSIEMNNDERSKLQNVIAQLELIEDSNALVDLGAKFNDAPVPVSTIPNQANTAGDLLTLDVTPFFSDPNEDVLVFSATLSDLTALPAWLSLTAEGVLSGTSPVGVAETLNLIITATDPDGAATAQMLQIDITL